MPTDDPPIGRRRLLESVTTIGLVGLVGGAGTWSIFSDGEVTVGTLAAGALDLKVAGGDARQTLRIEDAESGDEGLETVDLRNDGTVPGRLSLRLHLLSCETEDDDGIEDRPCEWHPDEDGSEKDSSGGSGKNDLADHLEVRIGFDRDGPAGGDDLADADVVVPWTYARDLDFENPYGSTHTLGAHGSAKDSSTLFLEWRTDETNEIQGETLGFGITVNLEQI